MKPEDLAALAIVSLFVGMLVLEAVAPARSYPRRTLWRVRGALLFVGFAALATVLPFLLPVAFMQEHRLLNLEGLGVFGGALVGWFVLSFFNYTWHRSSHRFTALWRGFHQIHHSPQRLDIASSMVFHPLDISMDVVIATFVTTFVLGLSPAAAAVVGVVSQFYAFFQHLNVNTPAWLGYFIQRPEQHFVHHSRDVHGFNYGDLPLWDLLFGTFKNPATFGAGEVGYASPADGRVLAMLAFQDVSDGAGTREPAARDRPVVAAAA